MGGARAYSDNDTDAKEDTYDVLVKAAAAITAGDVVFYDVTALDGISVNVANAATNLGLCCGVALADIASGAYGWVRRRGICTCNVLGAAGLAIGSTLKPVASQTYLTLGNATHTPSEHNPGFISLVAYTTTSAALKTVRVQLA